MPSETQYKNPNSVLVVIYCRDKALMLQRKDDPTFWQSVTGSLEADELPFDAALREVWEETGIDILAEGLTLVDCHEAVLFEIFAQFRYKYAPEVTHNREHWFLLALPDERAPRLTEHLAYQWLPIDEAIRLTKSPNNAAAMAKYVQPH